MLAGLPQAPSRYSPYTHWPEAKARQRYVLDRMYEVGFIDRETRDAALNEPISLASRKGSFQAAPYFVEHVRRCSRSATAAPCSTSSACACTPPSTCACRRRRRQALRERHRRAGRRGSAASAPAFATWSTRSARPTCGCRTLAFKGMDAPEPAFSYEALVTAVRGGSARVQVGPFSRRPGVPAERRRQASRRCSSTTSSACASPTNGDGPLRFEYDPSPTIEGALVAMTSTPATSRRWSAATTSSAAISTASPRPSASPARRSSRSSTPPRSTATSRRPR